jgi:uncharacterized protein (TIGR00730 family)
MRKSVTVFGSAMPLQGDAEYQTAYNLGKLLAANGFDVVNGGYFGIMEAVSKGVAENGGSATGITLSYLKRNPNEFLTKIISCNNLFERISKLIEFGDAYVILQGGTGTLLEFAAVWEYLNKDLIDRKPIACYSSMWKGIGEIMNEQLRKERKDTNLVSFFDDIEKLVEFIVKSLQGQRVLK